jgi:hypothetical protein
VAVVEVDTPIKQLVMEIMVVVEVVQVLIQTELVQQVVKVHVAVVEVVEN